MAVDHPGSLSQEVQRQRRGERRNGKATLQNASIGRGGLRVYDGGWIRIEDGGLAVTGTATVSGDLDVTGEETVSGTLTVTGILKGDGTIDWTGPVYFKGPTGVQGNFAVSGVSTFTGDVTLNSDLSVGTGRIVVGNMVLDKAGAYGGRIASGSGILLSTPTVLASGTLNATNSINSASGDIVATLGDIRAPFGDIGGNTKSFWIEHPTKTGKQLRHGSLEGPEHGVYYRGIVEFDDDGEAVFELPDYFTALVLEDDEPTVQVTPIGRPFLAGAERVTGGQVVVYGERNREAHVTVTAARGLFDVEPDKEAAVTDLP